MQSLLGQRCLLCGARSRHGLCAACGDSLPYLPPHRCEACALPIAGARLCGACLAQPPAFDRTFAVLRYAFPADALVHALKYQAHLHVAPILAELLLTRLDACPPPDLILPMPLHPEKLRERGFNHAQEIARWIAGRRGVPLQPGLCRRIRDTPPQAGLPWKARTRNVRGAFACEGDLAGRHIAIVDDVMTTGATLNELAKILRRQGAARVDGWIVVRTLPQAGDRHTPVSGSR
ncbi:ComF family protein [Nitrosovibrio sp. Nv17]|uniref:ComF family protein n=1 Tax=Nitrosovibrio sp. Nv17 TaxID=1855339 RepID=UPI0009085425|nr:ComF family protein [Nitrosovibrio sp. Nv17]SFW25234.1 comF family protein [Nitrosovibrio sp. Nv17]